MILGPSGSGKTTLLNLLGALDRPTSGDVTLDGVTLNALSETQLSDLRRGKVGFVFQHYNLIPTLTALENVEVALLPTGIEPAKRVERARTLLDRVGLTGRVSHLPSELSGGEQQRVAIARSLVNEPGLMLLDEPTGVLDTRTGREIMELVAGARKERGLTVVAVTHAGYVRSFADRALYMQDGRLLDHLPLDVENQLES